MATAPRTPTAEDFRECMAETPRTVSTASGPIEYAERGKGEPVLSIHGTLGGWDQGLVIAECLRVNGFRIIAPSRPGYLGTPLSTGRTFVEQGDAMAALLDALEIDRIIVFALSGGGPTGYELAARHPDRVSKLVQVDSVCIPGPIPRASARLFARDGFAKAQLWLLRHAPRRTLAALFRFAGSDSKAVASDRAATFAAIPDRLAPLEATLRASLGSARRRQGMDNDLTVFTPAPLERITCPTLIVHGRSDKTVPPASAEYAHAHIAGSELYWMDGSHFAFGLEAADTAPAHVVNWLRGDRDPVTRLDDDSTELAETSARFAEAIVSNDADRIAEFLDPEWRLIDADGVTTRRQFLDVVRSGALAHSMMQPIGALDIRVHGDVGVVCARVVNTAHFAGATLDADEWTTDVFVRRDDRWLCVHSHVTPAATE